MKDIEWLNQEFSKVAIYMTHGEPKVELTLGQVHDLVNQLKMPKLPEIPEYVANTIVYLQRRELEEGVIPQVVSVSELGDKLDVDDFNNTQEWVSKNFRKYAFAYAIGYEVEEKKYYVLLPKIKRNFKYISIIPAYEGFVDHYTDNKNDLVSLTEKEIKEIEPKYWVFAVPVEEVAN